MILVCEIETHNDEKNYWEIYRKRGVEDEDFMGIMLSDYVEEYINVLENSGLDVKAFPL